MIIKRVLSVSFIAVLPAGQNADVLAKMRELIERRDGQRIAFPYQTQAYRYRRMD